MKSIGAVAPAWTRLIVSHSGQPVSFPADSAATPQPLAGLQDPTILTSTALGGCAESSPGLCGVATDGSPRDCPMKVLREPSIRGTPPDACSADNRAARRNRRWNRALRPAPPQPSN